MRRFASSALPRCSFWYCATAGAVSPATGTDAIAASKTHFVRAFMFIVMASPHTAGRGKPRSARAHRKRIHRRDGVRDAHYLIHRCAKRAIVSKSSRFPRLATPLAGCGVRGARESKGERLASEAAKWEAARTSAYAPCSSWGVATGLDSAEPFSRRYTARYTIA